jgi:hypothetical protein
LQLSPARACRPDLSVLVFVAIGGLVVNSSALHPRRRERRWLAGAGAR